MQLCHGHLIWGRQSSQGTTLSLQWCQYPGENTWVLAKEADICSQVFGYKVFAMPRKVQQFKMDFTTQRLFIIFQSNFSTCLGEPKQRASNQILACNYVTKLWLGTKGCAKTKSISNIFSVGSNVCFLLPGFLDGWNENKWYLEIANQTATISKNDWNVKMRTNRGIGLLN